MGENSHHRGGEIAAIRKAIELAMTLIDTAEMYGEGASEALVGEAIRGHRDDVFLVTKVYPHNAGHHSAIQACERSLRRLGVDAIDLYLLHWRGSIPIEDTMAAFERLVSDGKIRSYGVSNFDTADMEAIPDGAQIATDQILYNLSRRNPELDLIPWLRARHIPVMAYSPVEQGRLLSNQKLVEVAKRRGATSAQIALAWLLNQPQVIAIPKAGNPRHVEENRAAAELLLSEEEVQALEIAFPRPRTRKPLEML
jgi:diketogulonate reductase-like aldo/keto reductase